MDNKNLINKDFKLDFKNQLNTNNLLYNLQLVMLMLMHYNIFLLCIVNNLIHYHDQQLDYKFLMDKEL